MFVRWLRMYPDCSRCGLSFFRESGYYVGGMIINYAVTAALVTTAYLVLLLFPDVPGLSQEVKIGLWLGFTILLSLALMRHSYSFWLGFDYWIDPWEPPVSAGGPRHARWPGEGRGR